MKREFFPYMGTVSHGTLRPEDLIPTFADVLEDLMNSGVPGGGMTPEWDADYRKLIEEARAIEWDTEDEDPEDEDPEAHLDNVDGILTELFDALESYAPDYFYFGSHPGDGADFGFWLSEEWRRSMKDDGVLFVDDTSDERIQSHTGLVAHVSDHGNLTLYRTRVELDEVWAVV